MVMGQSRRHLCSDAGISPDLLLMMHGNRAITGMQKIPRR